MSSPSKKWLAREVALVRIRDDPTLLHWRMALFCVNLDRVIVATPDRDISDTVLSVGEVYSDVIRLDGEHLPS